MSVRRFAFLTSWLLVGVLAVPASAQQKTVKQCNEEWTANKAAIQASGKTKKEFVAQCRGLATGVAAPATAPVGAPPAAAAGSRKTVRECNEEWTANKAAIQASGKTKKDFVAECRGVSGVTTNAPASGTPQPSTPPVAAPAAPPPQPPPAARLGPARTRPVPPPASTSPAGPNQFATEAEARSRCPSDTVVWVNLGSRIYHFSGNRNYGRTKNGAYMCEADTAAAGIRAAKNEKHP